MRALVTLPKRMEAVEGRQGSLEVQVVQLREETHAEFPAIRRDMRSFNEETRLEMHSLHAAMTERFDALYERGEDTRCYIRLLHQEVLERIARLDEDREG